MGRTAKAADTIPVKAASALTTLGINLRIARQRRGESLRSWAARMDVAAPTVMRMEEGDPTVGMGVYATALWLCGASDAMSTLAAPETDSEALELDIARAAGRRT